MKDKLYDNADSFAMSFDEEWKNIECEDLRLKIDKVFELLSEHPFLISNTLLLGRYPILLTLFSIKFNICRYCNTSVKLCLV